MVTSKSTSTCMHPHVAPAGCSGAHLQYHRGHSIIIMFILCSTHAIPQLWHCWVGSVTCSSDVYRSTLHSALVLLGMMLHYQHGRNQTIFFLTHCLSTGFTPMAP